MVGTALVLLARPFVSFTELIRALPDAPWEKAWRHLDNSLLGWQIRPNPDHPRFFPAYKTKTVSYCPAINNELALSLSTN